MRKTKKICCFCKKEYEGDNASIYCSAECRRAMEKKRKEKEIANRAQICAFCGVVFYSDRRKKYCCDKCRDKANGKRSAKPRKKAKMSIEEVAKLCRKEGLSYGQYVAKYGL